MNEIQSHDTCTGVGSAPKCPNVSFKAQIQATQELFDQYQAYRPEGWLY